MKVYVGFETLDTNDWVSITAFLLQWVRQSRRPKYVHTYVLIEDGTRIDFSIKGITVMKVTEDEVLDLVLVQVPYDIDCQSFFATVQTIANLDVRINLWDVFSSLFLNNGNHCVSVTSSLIGYMPYNYTADQLYDLVSNDDEINTDCIS